MSRCADAAIVGAGPYGLSLAAHFRDSGIGYRIFGSPMETWRERMPDGMLLKSDGFASSLSDPASAFTLKHFCAMTGTPYDDKRVPVRLETFRAYGLAFQQRMVPDLEDTKVTKIERNAGVFVLDLADGTTAVAQRVVLAVGISHFQHVPRVLSHLPAEFLSHSSAHSDVRLFGGRDVAVIGGGASAIDIAVLLKDAGASVTLIARRSALRFADPPPERSSQWDAMRYPSSPIGPGWKSRLCCDAPWLFRGLPRGSRMRLVRSFLGPAAGWPMKQRFVGHIPVLLGCVPQSAEIRNGRVHLRLARADATIEHRTDHVIAATGYEVDLPRLTFLSADILSRIHSFQGSPLLSSDFESSVPGLYFVGMSSMYNFGPMMRFTCGADWTSRRIARAVAKSSRQARSLVAEAATRW